MALFSRRTKLVGDPEGFQTESLDRATRVALWNAMVRTWNEDAGNVWDETPEYFPLRTMWAEFLSEPLDDFPEGDKIWHVKERVKHAMFEGEWFASFDAVEVFAPTLDDARPGFEADINAVLERYMVSYRLMGGVIVPLDPEAAIAVARALDDADVAPFESARKHLSAALQKLSDRANPDFRGSVHDSVSAVEALVRTFTGAKTLGAGLSQLSSAGIESHPAFLAAWKAFYGWASDAGGVRHGAPTFEEPSREVAQLMLVSSSAYVSYLVETARKVGPQPSS